METKKAKVTKITKMDKKDNYGNTSFIIELENGDKGFYRSQSEEQKKFIVGQLADYLIEEQQGAKGKWYKITPPKSENNFKGGGGRPAVDPKVQLISFAMAYTKDLVVAGIVPLKDMNMQFDIMYNEMISKL